MYDFFVHLRFMLVSVPVHYPVYSAILTNGSCDIFSLYWIDTSNDANQYSEHVYHALQS